MDYTALAEELLDVRAGLLQVPANQQLSKMVRGELFVLNYLNMNKKVVHPKELSEKMAVSTARIASLLNRLEEKGLVQRYLDQDDNRQVIVLLTEKGRQEIQQSRTEVISYVRTMLEEIGPEDAETYVRIHKKILSGFLANY